MTPKFEFQKKTIKSLKDVVYDTIKEAILSGKLSAGERLIESEISRQMGISRGPIREAFQHLEQDGLVYSQPYKETVVAELSPREADEVYVPIRRIVELYACSRAKEILTDSDYDILKCLIGDLKIACDAGDMVAATRIDAEFHQYIVTKCASQTLLSIWNSISTQISVRIHAQNKYKNRFDAIPPEHDDLLDAMRSGSKKDIENLLLQHIS